ncbi:MAG: recombinase RecA [Planctomycetota bacterium]|nr:MAG: recombinase RecA [Planctomycetota bacterium]
MLESPRTDRESRIENIAVAAKKSKKTSSPSNASSKTGASKNDREKALQSALANIEKNHGKGAVLQMTSDYIVPIDGISSGSLSLDLALGGRGLPRGRICELYGPEGSGKTTLALEVVAQAQKNGGYAAFIDAEHAFDPEYAQRVGVQMDGLRFSLSQPSYGEEGLDIAEQFIKSGAVDVIVVDSVAALVPKAEIDGEIGDTFVGVQARMMSQALRRLTTVVGKTKAVVIFINQLREKIGVMFGNPETTPGGRALKFYSSVRIDVRRIGALKQGEKIIGNRTKATVVKNKVAPPFRRAEFDILYGTGISMEGDVLDMGLQHGIVQKSGAWFSMNHPEQGELRLGQGREMVRQLLVDNPDLCQQISTLITAQLQPAKESESESKASESKAAAKGQEQSKDKDQDKEMESGAGAAPARKTVRKKATRGRKSGRSG